MDEICPKCGAEKSDDSCPRCGLVFIKFTKEALEEGVPDDLKLLWQEVERNWQDRGHHAAFVERSIAGGAGGYAAACYRRRGDDPIATEQIDRIKDRLTQMLGDSASVAGSSRPGTTGRMALGLILAIAAAAVALIVLLKRGLV